jgi:hypothetical protein
VLHSWSCRVTVAAADIRQASPSHVQVRSRLSVLTHWNVQSAAVCSPFTGVVGLCRIHPLHRSGGPVSYDSPSQEWWACVVYIPFTGVAGLCRMNPLHRSGGPVSYDSPSQEWWACVVYIPFTGVAGLCRMNPLHRSGGPVSYTSPSQEWRACVV